MRKNLRQCFAGLVLVSAVATFCVPLRVPAQLLKPVRAKHAMVASQHALASEIGVDIMRKGGNAVDAAIAVGIALAVVYPEAGNIGGGGFMLIRDAKGNSHFIDYREMAPKAATRDLYVDPSGALIEGEGSSTVGYRASGVPGTLAGFDLAFKKYGSRKVSWAQLVEPARRIAAQGFRLSYRQTELFKDDRSKLSRYEDANRIFLRGGKLFGEDEVLVQSDLAETLGRIKLKGAREFYTGKTAEMIASDMKAHNGLITLDDLRNYQAKERQPLTGSYRGYGIVTAPPPSGGGIVMLEVLNILEGYDLGKMNSSSAAKYHLVAEAMRRGFADRAEYMGDADFANVPVAKLIDKAYAAKRRASIDVKRASTSRSVGPGQFAEGTETTHYTVVDPQGMVVSNTYTINDLFGSKVVAKGTGILLNDEMDDFASRPDRPNLYGLIQGERNKIEPGKRPLSSMTPTIVLNKDGSVWFALGARGGPRITSAVIQIVSNVVDYGMDIQAAVDAPRIHHQWLPDEIRYEPTGFSTDTLDILTGYGHKLIDNPGYVASATAISIEGSGVRMGAIDSRSDGLAMGY